MSYLLHHNNKHFTRGTYNDSSTLVLQKHISGGIQFHLDTLTLNICKTMIFRNNIKCLETFMISKNIYIEMMPVLYPVMNRNVAFITLMCLLDGP